MTDRWIDIPNWDGPEGFQHYTDRDPTWIKNYTRLLSHDAYLELSTHRRGILHGIWLAYASSAGRLPGDTLTLTRRLNGRVSTADLEALNHAGFIEILASTHARPRTRGASPHARPPTRERQKEEKEVEELSVGESSSSNRSDETQTQRASPNGLAALDTTEDIPLQRVGPNFPCSECAQTFTNWEERQIHLDLDHALDKERA